MTEEEDIKKAAKEYVDNEWKGCGQPQYDIQGEDMQYAFEDGAKWAKKEMADYKKVAVDAHRLGCGYYNNGKCDNINHTACDIKDCDDNCVYMQKFKELINK